MMTKMLLVDGVYESPDEVRDLALSAEFEDVRAKHYPGHQSRLPFVSASVIAKIEDVIGGPIAFDQEHGAFGKFRLMPEGPNTDLRIHLDGIAGWTGVLYLNPPDQCQGGTVFYRHKSTGLDGPPNRTGLEKLGFQSYEEFERTIVVPDSVNESAWEQQSFVGMRCNRLVLFRGNELFHSHACGFGSGRYDSRLTQNFFFECLPDSTVSG